MVVLITETKNFNIKNYLYTFAGGISCALLAFSYGTTITWTSPVFLKITNSTGNNEENPFDKPVTSEQQSWIASSLNIGIFVGTFLGGFLTNKIGRKYTMIFASGVPIAIHFFILAFTNIVFLYYVARFIGGIAAGVLTTNMPLYFAEIPAPEIRGRIGSFLFIFVCIGEIFSYSLGAYVSIKIFSLTCAIIPCLFLLFFSFFPDSPYYYVIKKDFEAAEKSLAKFRNSTIEETKQELELIKNNVENDFKNKGKLKYVLKNKGFRRAFVACLYLVSIQQLSGISAVLFYSSTIFEAAGTDIDPNISSIILGSIRFVSSCFTSMLIDKLGRKLLLIISAIGMCLSEAILGLYFYLKEDNFDVSSLGWLPLTSLIMFMNMYNFGFGPLPLIYVGEVFPSHLKAPSSSFIGFFSAVISFLVTYLFPISLKQIGIGITFWIFSGFNFIGIFVAMIFVIETKGKSLIEIINIFNQ